MLIVEIALGIVLAVLILRYLPQILALSAAAIVAVAILVSLSLVALLATKQMNGVRHH